MSDMNADTLKYLFGRRVQSIRATHGMTQETLAEKAGISPEYVSRIERGNTSPSFGTISRVAEALQVRVKTLFDFSDLDKGSY